MEKRNFASKESGADFLAHNLTLKTPLVYAFARLKESSGVADFLYPMDYSLTFICFDWWCKMWGFAPNPLSRPEMEHRCQKWTHRANQKWSSTRTRNGHHHEPEMDASRVHRNGLRPTYHSITSKPYVGRMIVIHAIKLCDSLESVTTSTVFINCIEITSTVQTLRSKTLQVL